MENSMKSSEPQANQKKTSSVDVMSLVKELYAKRELMPMQAEPNEPMFETDDGTTTTKP